LTALLHSDRHTREHPNKSASCALPEGTLAWHSEHGHLPPAAALPTSALSMESQLASVSEEKHLQANKSHENKIRTVSGKSFVKAENCGGSAALPAVLLYRADNARPDRYSFLPVSCE